MDVLLLRTLAWKSQMGFGKYYDLSVMEVYNLEHTRYLRWCYYNLSMISFQDEILKAIYIKEKYKIEKPGTNPELHEKLNGLITAGMDKMKRIKMFAHLRSRNKKKLCSDEINRLKSESKRKRQGKNQGKFKSE